MLNIGFMGRLEASPTHHSSPFDVVPQTPEMVPLTMDLAEFEQNLSPAPPVGYEHEYAPSTPPGTMPNTPKAMSPSWQSTESLKDNPYVATGDLVLQNGTPISHAIVFNQEPLIVRTGVRHVPTTPSEPFPNGPFHYHEYDVRIGGRQGVSVKVYDAGQFVKKDEQAHLIAEVARALQTFTRDELLAMPPIVIRPFELPKNSPDYGSRADAMGASGKRRIALYANADFWNQHRLAFTLHHEFAHIVDAKMGEAQGHPKNHPHFSSRNDAWQNAVDMDRQTGHLAPSHYGATGGIREDFAETYALLTTQQSPQAERQMPARARVMRSQVFSQTLANLPQGHLHMANPFKRQRPDLDPAPQWSRHVLRRS
jgi:hypothetical protein